MGALNTSYPNLRIVLRIRRFGVEKLVFYIETGKGLTLILTPILTTLFASRSTARIRIGSYWFVLFSGSYSSRP